MKMIFLAVFAAILAAAQTSDQSPIHECPEVSILREQVAALQKLISALDADSAAMARVLQEPGFLAARAALQTARAEVAAVDRKLTAMKKGPTAAAGARGATQPSQMQTPPQ